MKKIVVIEKNRKIYENLSRLVGDWKYLDVIIEHSYQMIDFKLDYDRYIIDVDTIDSVGDFIQKHKDNNKIIVALNYANKEVSNEFICNNIDVVFKSFGMSSLVYKIFGILDKVNEKTAITQKENRMKSSKIITVTSPSGGTGKSVFSFSMAYFLAQKGKSVLFLDFSTIGNTEVLLDKYLQGKSYIDFFSEVQGKNELDTASILDLFEKSVTYFEDGKCKFDILFGTSPIKMESVDEEVVDKLIFSIKELAYDLVIIDTGSELNKRNFTLVEASDEVILFTIPDINNGWKLIQYRELLDYIQVTHKCSFVVNKYDKNDGFSCSELETELQMPLKGVIPNRKPMHYYLNKGTIADFINKDSYGKYVKGIVQNYYPVFSKTETKQYKVHM